MQIVGWLAMVLSLSGHALAARGDRRGWAVRFLAGWLWMAFAFSNGALPYIATSVIYTGLDLFAFLRRRVKVLTSDS